MSDKPAYTPDGEPTNLAGAANDAADWLRLMAWLMDESKLTLMQHDENRRRLQVAIDNVMKFVEVL